MKSLQQINPPTLCSGDFFWVYTAPDGVNPAMMMGGLMVDSLRFRYDIRLHLIGIGQAVGAVEHIHHGDQLGHSLVVQSEPLHGGTVGVDSVGAVVGDRDGQGDHLLGQHIQFAGLHDGF